MEFDDYVAQQRRALLRFATMLTGQPWLADDVVSDVLGRAFERWDRIGTMAEPNAYVRRMIVNDHLSWQRGLKRTTPRADIEPSTEPLRDSAEEYAERDAMIKRLSQLPRRQRTAIVLRYYIGLSDADIAAHLRCREPTVRSYVSRALAALRLDPTPIPTSSSESR